VGALVTVTRRGRLYLNRSLTLVAVLFALAFLPGTSFCADLLKPPYVSKIEIVGNEVFSDGKLKGVMKTKERSVLRPFRKSAFRKDFLQADIESILGLYRRHGHLKARIDSQRVDRVRKGKAVRIYLDVFEGPRTMVDAINLEGVSALTEKQLRKGLRLKEGSPFDPYAVEDDKRKLLGDYAEAGHIYASVSDNTVFNGDRAHVYYIIKEGILARAGAVHVEGNKVTGKWLVRREVALRQGDVLRRSRLVRTQQRIYDTGLYSDVRLSPLTGDSVASVVDLMIIVKERKMAWVGTGIGYGSSDQLRVFGEWGHRNILRSGQRFFTSANFAFGRWLLNERKAVLDESRFEIGTVEPWLFGTRTAGQLVGYREYKKETAFSEEFDGFTFTAKRDLSAHSKLFVSYDNRWVHTTDPAAPWREYITRSLYLSSVRDTRDDIFDPGRGSFQDLSWKVAGGVLGGNYSFQKVSGSSSWYYPLGGMVLATRVKVGFAEPFGEARGITSWERIPFEERFRTGGATSVRGYRENDEVGPRDVEGTVTGGRFLLLTNLEARFPLFWRISGALFLDGGSVWKNPSDVRLRDFDPGISKVGDSDYRYSYGAGLRLETPVGPVRVDYGRKLRLSDYDGDDRGQFHFSLGQAF
jgi:outer membrane protein insertion porin family